MGNMNTKLRNAIKTYLNPDTVFAMANSVFTLIRGPFVMIMIPLFLTDVTQGYWYTFGSLSALSTFADLGFGTLVGQFSAHEFSKLKFNDKYEFLGDEEQIKKIASLFKYVIKWALCVCLIAYPIIMIVGVVVLNTHGNMNEWILPWLIFMFSGGFSFVVRNALSFFEGCSLISKIQVNFLISTVLSTIVTIAMLATKCGLYALAIPSVVGFLSNAILMLAVFRRPLLQIYRSKSKVNYRWGKNFLSLIWKYALSWASGYFVFQIYTPLAFMVYDPVAAGKIGITMTLVQACYSIANTFNYVFVPKLNMAVAGREWKRAESYMKKGMLVSMPLYLLGSAIIFLMLGLLQGRVSIFDRFMSVGATSFLAMSWFLQIPINVIATYGRAHKQEPFLVMSIVGSLITFLLTLIIIYTLPIDYLFMGFALSNLISVFIFALMFYKLRGKWHASLIKKQEESELLRLQALSAGEAGSAEDGGNDNQA